LKAAVKEASAASMKAAEARVRCDEQERAVAGLEAAAGHVGAVGDIAALEVQVGRLYALAAVADDELQGFAREETAARAAETDARIESGVLERRVRALAGHSTCPVCEQKLPELLIHDLQRSMSEAVRVAEQRAAERAQRASDSAASVAELREEAATLRKRAGCTSCSGSVSATARSTRSLTTSKGWRGRLLVDSVRPLVIAAGSLTSSRRSNDRATSSAVASSGRWWRATSARARREPRASTTRT
jgi:hypothetical protein